jgi:hypothetical protein
VSAVDKLLELAGPGRITPAEDPAGEMVLAARTALREVRAYLASGDDDEDDGKGGSDDHSSHSTFKALKKRGMDDAKAKSLCAKADNRVKAARLAQAADIALSSLATPQHNWVEATAETPDLAALACGTRDYADPGYRGRQRFRTDTEPNVRLSLSYAWQAAHAAGYTEVQLAQVRARVEAAARQHGIVLEADEERIAGGVLLGLSVLSTAERKKPGAHTIGDSEDYPIPDRAHLTAAIARYKQGKLAGHSKQEVAAHIRSSARRLGVTVDLTTGCGLEEAAELVALAKKPMGDGGVVMNHGPFNGTHSHSHFQSNAHDHPHQHFGDNHHDGGPAHRPGSKPGGRAGW